MIKTHMRTTKRCKGSKDDTLASHMAKHIYKTKFVSKYYTYIWISVLTYVQVDSGGSTKSVNSSACVWSSKNWFRCFPLVLNTWLVLGFSFSIMPWGHTIFTLNSFVHRKHNVLGNKWSHESYNSILSDGLNVRCKIC